MSPVTKERAKKSAAKKSASADKSAPAETINDGAVNGTGKESKNSGELSAMLLPDLKKVAAQLGIDGAAKMSKGDLVESIGNLQAANREAAKLEREQKRLERQEARNKRNQGRDERSEDSDDSDDSDDSIAGEKPSTQKKKHAAHDIPSILDLFGIKTANQAVIVPPDASKPLAAVLRSLHVWSKDKQLSTRHGLHRIADRAADDPNATNDPGAAKHEETRRSKRSSGELDAPTSKKVAVCSSSDDHPKYSGKKLSVVFHDFECVYVLCKFSRLTKVSDKVENTPAIVVEHF